MAEFDAFLGKVLTEIVNPLIGLMFALAIGYFLYGVFQFMANQDNEEMKTTGKSHMVWGIVGIAIMLGVWGIMGFITRSFGFDRDIKIQNQGDVNIDLKR